MPANPLRTRLLVLPLLGLTSLAGCLPVAIGAATGTGVGIAQERTVGDAVDDTTIWAKIKSDMLQKNVDNLFGLVDVKVHEGRVLMTGSVKDPETRMEAARIAWSQRGVKEVINELTVATPTGKMAIKDYSLDTWITTQIKSKLLMEKDIKSVNYGVETIGGTVYLLGIAQNQEELDRVTAVAGTVKYVQKVVSHVRVKDAPLRKQDLTTYK